MKSLITDYLIIAMLMVGVYACATYAQSPCDTTLTRVQRGILLSHLLDSLKNPGNYQPATKGYVDDKVNSCYEDLTFYIKAKMDNRSMDEFDNEMKKEHEENYAKHASNFWKAGLTLWLIALTVLMVQK